MHSEVTFAYVNQPFTPRMWSISNFSCSLTRNITPHNMENLFFPWLTQMKCERSFETRKGYERIQFWTGHSESSSQLLHASFLLGPRFWECTRNKTGFCQAKYNIWMHGRKPLPCFASSSQGRKNPGKCTFVFHEDQERRKNPWSSVVLKSCGASLVFRKTITKTRQVPDEKLAKKGTNKNEMASKQSNVEKIPSEEQNRRRKSCWKENIQSSFVSLKRRKTLADLSCWKKEKIATKRCVLLKKGQKFDGLARETAEKVSAVAGLVENLVEKTETLPSCHLSEKRTKIRQYCQVNGGKSFGGRVCWKSRWKKWDFAKLWSCWKKGEHFDQEILCLAEVRTKIRQSCYRNGGKSFGGSVLCWKSRWKTEALPSCILLKKGQHFDRSAPCWRKGKHFDRSLCLAEPKGRRFHVASITRNEMYPMTSEPNER